MKPELRILELVDVADAARVERRWIRRLHRRGFALMNVHGTGRPRKPAPPYVPRDRSPARMLDIWRSFSGRALTPASESC
jgi:hypothetical protein